MKPGSVMSDIKRSFCDTHLLNWFVILLIKFIYVFFRFPMCVCMSVEPYYSFSMLDVFRTRVHE